jgi:4-hydroxy-3-methylbut-2-enyl diphosphate reductase
MQVLLAEALGMCFGVRDAIESARAVESPDEVTIFGELVHNPEVNAEMALRGFESAPESSRAAPPPTPAVLITAHGVSDRERARLIGAGKRVIDTTCPLVRRAHDAARRLEASGHLVIVIGKRGHVEVEGLIGDLDRCDVIESAAEARSYDAERLGVICQTTTPPRRAREVLAALKARNPGTPIEFADTICQPTRDRQEAVERLLGSVDALVVVGGRQSRNTLELGRLADERGKPWLRVESAGEIEPSWFAPYKTVGLTAGTSTTDAAFDAVREAILAL